MIENIYRKEEEGGGDVQSSPSSIGKVISLPTQQSPNFLNIHVRLHHSTPSLPPGAWVSVSSSNAAEQPCLILGRVLNTWEHNPHEDAQGSTVAEVLPFITTYAPEGESTVIFRVAEVELMEEALLDASGGIACINEVSTLPRAGSPVFSADQHVVSDALGLETDAELGFEIGRLRDSADTTIAAILKRDTVQRHMLICGGIGSGKSYLRGVLAEELHMQGVPQINIDPNGEMVEATEQLGGVNLVPGKKGFTLPLSSLTPDDVIDAIPGMRSGTNYETLIRYAHEALIKERTVALGERFHIGDLLDKIREVAPDLHMQTPATLLPAIQRAKSLEDVPYIGDAFDWEKHLKPGVIINIDCRGLLISDLRLIVASVARDLQRLARKDDNLFVAFSMDEFHLAAPNDDKSVTTQVLREIARIGRHYKIGLILTTQSPQDVDRSILKRLLTRFLFAIEPDQLDALRGVFSDASEALVKTLPKLPQGRCIITGAKESIRHATIVDIRERLTAHGGKTPDIWNDFAKRGWTKKSALKIGGGESNE